MDISAHIKSQGLDRGEICRKAEISRSFLSLIEKGDRQIGWDKAAVLADALGLRPSDLRPDLAAIFAPEKGEGAAT